MEEREEGAEMAEVQRSACNCVHIDMGEYASLLSVMRRMAMFVDQVFGVSVGIKIPLPSRHWPLEHFSLWRESLNYRLINLIHIQLNPDLQIPKVQVHDARGYRKRPYDTQRSAYTANRP